MTADEQEAEDIRQAQETKDIADAQAAKQAEIDAAAGLGNEGVSGNELVGAGKSFVRGAGRGFANIPEPSDVITGITNIPKRLENDYNAKIHPAIAGPEGWNSPPPLPVELNKNPYHLGVSENYNKDFPVDPNHPFADVVGQVAGPAIVEGVATGGASIPGQVAGAGRALVTTTGGLLGGEAGGEIDRALGGSGEIGSVIGGGLGGGVVPGLVTQAGWKGLSTAFTNDSSAARLAAVKRLNQIPGVNIPESLGLVGNKFAGQVEDATAAVPFGGGSAYRAREAQHQGMDTAAREIANQMRDGPADIRGINPSTIGDKVKDLSTAADTSAEAAQNAVLNPLYEQVGRDEPIDQTAQLAEMDRIRRSSQPQYRAPVETEISNVNASRLDPLNAPKVVDPGLEAQLQMQINQAKRRLDGANSVENAKAAQDELDSLQAQQTANRGQTFQETVESRSKTGRRVEGQQPLDAAQTLAIKAAQTDAMKQAAQLAGISPEEFDAANARYGELAVQREIFDKISNAPGQGEAYNKLFGGTSRHNLDQLNALYEHAPDQLRSAMADEFELRTRGSNAGLRPSAEAMDTTKSAPKWWSGIPEEARTYVSPSREVDQNADALSAVMRSDSRRPGRTLPGAGGGLSLGNIFKQSVIPISTAGGFALGGPVGAAVAGAAPSVLAKGTGAAFTNPNFVNRVINPGPWFNDPNTLSRIMAAAYGGGQSNQ